MRNDLVPVNSDRNRVLYVDPQGNVGQLREQPRVEQQQDVRVPHHDTPPPLPQPLGAFQRGVQVASKVTNAISGFTYGVVGAKAVLAAGGVILGAPTAAGAVGIGLALATGYIGAKVAIKVGEHLANWVASKDPQNANSAATAMRAVVATGMSGLLAWPTPLLFAGAQLAGGALNKAWHWVRD